MLKRLGLVVCWVVLASLWWTNLAAAHGGNYVISETRDQYFVVVSLAPGPMSVGRGDASIAVRNSSDFAALPVDTISVVLIDPDGEEFGYTPAPESRPEDAIYGSHDLDFSSSGEWQFLLRLTEAGQTQEFRTTVNVAGGIMRWLNVILYMVPIIVLAILITLAALRNRMLRKAALESDSHAT
ncbi:hypothetical protein [Herpetosiphon giganteus]|uniref:hypothetical protein n=1 Tax=Herpetosiphon giganteus TaxID=2029754 RepID=UPI001956C0B6|nr:hypothetical protein [Herpetosiphon giganteus]MBM7842707.1 hypothetical protein [Herpetosiphon giganteus]